MSSPDKGRTEDLGGGYLLDLLAVGLAQNEPIPGAAMAQAYAACLMAAVDAELAELVFDSSKIERSATRGGSESESRFLSFANDHVTLDISFLGDGKGVVGQLEPAVTTELKIEGSDGNSTVVHVDKFGRFKTSIKVPSFRIRVTGQLVTQWITR